MLNSFSHSPTIHSANLHIKTEKIFVVVKKMKELTASMPMTILHIKFPIGRQTPIQEQTQYLGKTLKKCK